MKTTISLPAQAAAGFLAALLTVGPLLAGNTWDGGGTTGNWSDANNWDSNTLPTSPGALTFNGSLQLASNNDQFGPATTFNGITFGTAAGAFNLSGNSITLGGDVTNASSNLQTIAMDLVLSGTRIFTSNTATGNFSLGGVISGSGNFRKSGTAGSSVTLASDSNSYTGTTRVDAGNILIASSIGNIGTNSSVGAGSTAANSLDIRGILRYTGGSASSNRSFYAMNGTIEVASAATNLTLSGTQSDNDSAAQLYLTKTGAGTLTLTGVAGGSGLNIGVIVNQGTLNSSGTGTASFGRLASATVNNGATLQLGGNDDQIVNAGALTVNAGGTADLLASQIVGTIGTTDSGGVITSSTSGAKTLRVSSNTANSTFSGVIQNGAGTVGLRKTGAATTLILTGNNTYTGTTLVSNGTLLINGALAAGSAVTVENTGILGGTGTIGGNTTLNAGAKLSPGDNSASQLTFSNGLNLSAAANDTAAFIFTLGTASDKVFVGGTLTIGSGLLNFADFSFTAGPGFAVGTYTLFENSVLSGTLAGTGLSGTIGGLDSTLAISGSNIVLNVIPEPSCAGLLILGAAALALARRRYTKIS